MQKTFSRRGIVRVVSFAAALILGLSFFCYTNLKRAQKAELQLEYQYLKNIDDLTTHMDNIDNTLLKLLYSGSPTTMTPLASKLWRETGFPSGWKTPINFYRRPAITPSAFPASLLTET